MPPPVLLGRWFADRSAKGVGCLGILESIVSVILALLLGWLGNGLPGALAAGLALAAAGVWYLWYIHMVRKQFGGVTGDLLGYLVESCQLFMLVILAVVSMFLY